MSKRQKDQLVKEHPRILYLQFTDPAGYPPIQHSSELFSEDGWNVIFLGIGTETFGDAPLSLPEHPQIQVRKLPWVRSRLWRKFHYLRFLIWSLYWIGKWRPAWIYASDPLSAPVALLAGKLPNVRIVYHEHDSPDADLAYSYFMRIVIACRDRLARSADVCVLPQGERLNDFLKRTGRRRPSYCVWNCPRIGEVREAELRGDDNLIVYYHGSINKFRLPPQLVEAACRFKGKVRLRIAGYETVGSVGYVEELMRLAVQNGTPDLIEWIGAIPFRDDLLRAAVTAHVGLSFMPNHTDDINMSHMVGASNKPFDYMALGLPLLVSAIPEWTATFVTPGFARACNPDDSGSIETELRWYLDHPAERRDMGRKCSEQIRMAWNYEAMFADVRALVENDLKA